MAFIVVAFLVSPPAASDPDSPNVDELLSQPLYGLHGPGGAYDRIEELVPTRDGNMVYYEAYRPVQVPGGPAVGRAPVILMMTPYAYQDTYDPNTLRHIATIEHFVPRGYAVAIGHVIGTGHSTGCLDMHGPAELEGTVTVIENLTAAPWSSGAIAMYGISYDALVQIPAASYADASRIAGLRAIVPVSGFAAEYDNLYMDGVPGYPILGLYTAAFYSTREPWLPGPSPAQPWPLGLDRVACRQERFEASAQGDLDGRYSEFHARHDARPAVGQTRAAVLFSMGLSDRLVMPSSAAGWFDALPAATPHKAIIHQRSHAFPDEPGGPLDDGGKFGRADWDDLVLAWFDEHLKGKKMQTHKWPDVQVQDLYGRWRAAADWPYTGDRPVQLAIGLEGLGGSSGGLMALPVDGAVFKSAPVTKPLHLSGIGVLDLTVSTDDPSTRITARLQAYDADGHPLTRAPVFGGRPVAYRDAMPDRYFHQQAPSADATGAVRLPIRLQATDLTVPVGGWLEVWVGTADKSCYLDTCMVAAPAQVTLHLDCSAPSILRLEVAHSPRFLRVPVADGTLPTAPAENGTMDGGIAQHKVCGKAAVRPLDVVQGVA